MEKLIHIDNLRSYAYCNHLICERPIRGLVISFYGLGGTTMHHEDPREAVDYARQGILFLIPYQNPWSWMNRQTVALVDELVDVLFRELSLPQTLPIISTGGSMGGLCCLTYAAYAKRVPVACVANCPVCDLPYHFTERPDLPRTLYSAFHTYDGTLEEALRSASPLHLTDQLPKNAEYHIFHCEEDLSVNKQLHSDRFVAALSKEHSVFYYPVPGKGHCNLTEEAAALWRSCILDACAKHNG